MALLLALIGLIVYVDQLSKWLVVIFLDVNESVPIIPGILRFTYIQNDGAAFGMLDDHRWIFMIASTVAIVGLLLYLWRRPPESRLCRISIAFLIGGGIGNMIDRVLLGYVIDFIDFCAFPKIWMWVFNVADSFVTVGAGMLMVYLVIETVKEYRRERAKKLAPEGGASSESEAETDAAPEGDACAEKEKGDEE